MRVGKIFMNRVKAGKLLAFANISFKLSKSGNACLTIKGFKLFTSENGYFVQPPSEKNGDQYYDKIFVNKKDPDGEALWSHITEEVIAEYKKENEEEVKTTKGKTTSYLDEDEEDGIKW